jgi:hypothetical protein
MKGSKIKKNKTSLFLFCAIILEFYEYLYEDMAKKLLIELPYLGNLAFYQLLTQFNEVLIEKHEFFEKSSFRNRCEVTGPNGKLVLSVPVAGGKDGKKFYKGTKISYDHTWLKDHWNSLTSAYRRSPYFEYYEDKFDVIFSEKYENLFDFNWALFQLIAELLKMDIQFNFTEKFEKVYEDSILDYRSHFLPRKPVEVAIKYVQVFEDRTGFLPNLSIVDLLFNEGPNSLNILKSANNV